MEEKNWACLDHLHTAACGDLCWATAFAKSGGSHTAK